MLILASTKGDLGSGFWYGWRIGHWVIQPTVRRPSPPAPCRPSRSTLPPALFAGPFRVTERRSSWVAPDNLYYFCTNLATFMSFVLHNIFEGWMEKETWYELRQNCPKTRHSRPNDARILHTPQPAGSSPSLPTLTPLPSTLCHGTRGLFCKCKSDHEIPLPNGSTSPTKKSLDCSTLWTRPEIQPHQSPSTWIHPTQTSSPHLVAGRRTLTQPPRVRTHIPSSMKRVS